MIPRSDFKGRPVDLHEARRRAQVSDNALVRYLEHVKGFDLDAVRRQILSDAVLQGMVVNANCVRGSGYKLIIDNFIVVSAVPVEAVALTTRRRRGVEG